MRQGQHAHGRRAADHLGPLSVCGAAGGDAKNSGGKSRVMNAEAARRKAPAQLLKHTHTAASLLFRRKDLPAEHLDAVPTARRTAVVARRATARPARRVDVAAVPLLARVVAPDPDDAEHIQRNRRNEQPHPQRPSRRVQACKERHCVRWMRRNQHAAVSGGARGGAEVQVRPPRSRNRSRTFAARCERRSQRTLGAVRWTCGSSCRGRVLRAGQDARRFGTPQYT